MWLAWLFFCLAIWTVLRSWNWLQKAAPNVPITNLTGSYDPKEHVTREEGLLRLAALVDEKPVPENCEDIKKFLLKFQQNREKWKVTKHDLQEIYMNKFSMFDLLRNWAMTKSCCPHYESFLD